MKYSYFGVAMIFFGLLGLVLIIMFESITFDNDSEYYVLKESMEAAMLESVDLPCYRSTDVERDEQGKPVMVNGKYVYKGCHGVNLKISEQKFVENFVRRFSQSISGNVSSYTIKFYDIIESPPKATIVVTSHNKDYKFMYGDDSLDITNNLSGILQTVD